jgi:hypothetical protein
MGECSMSKRLVDTDGRRACRDGARAESWPGHESPGARVSAPGPASKPIR